METNQHQQCFLRRRQEFFWLHKQPPPKIPNAPFQSLYDQAETVGFSHVDQCNQWDVTAGIFHQMGISWDFMLL